MWIITDALLKAYENSHYSPEQVEESLADTSSDGEPCVPLNTTDMPLRSWLRGKTTEPYVHFQFGMTCKPLTESLGEAVLTWFLEDFLVKIYPPQEKEKELKVNDLGYGRNSRELFTKWDQDTSSWKTPQSSLFVESTLYSGIWPRWGMMQHGECWEPTLSELPTSANGYGSSVSYPTPVVYDSTPGGPNNHYNGLGKMARFNTWPTPRAANPGSRPNGKGGRVLSEEILIAEGLRERGELKRMWPTPDTCAGGTGPSQMKRNSPRLQDVVKWPTPLVSDATATDCVGNQKRKSPPLETMIRRWPTPTASDSNQRRATENWKGNDLVAQVTKEEEDLGNSQPLAGGRLNPMWVEWLMGWPIGWTSLEPLETDRFQQWQQEHLSIYIPN